MVYESGLYFSDAVKKNIDVCLERLDINKAVMVIIEGGLGEGKTTLMKEMLDYINQKRGFGKVDLKLGMQIALGGADFVNKIRLCYENGIPCCGYDEAGDFSKRGSLTYFNAMLNRTFETFRAFKCVVILALPNFNVLDNDIFDKKIPRFMLRLHDRTMNQGNFDGYSLYRMLLLKAKMKRYDLKEFAYKKIEPNFHGHFQNLPKEEAELLEKLSTKSKLNILQKAEVKMAGLLSYVDLATKLSRTVGSVRNSVSNLKIKPSRIIKKIAYFDNDALNQLEELFNYNADMRKNPRELEKYEKEQTV
jgi:hypothetical protein